MTPAPTTRPVGVLLLGIGLAAGTCVLVAAALALAFPGSGFEMIWRLYPARRALMMPYRAWLVPGFVTLAFPMGAASLGCLRRRTWGWRLTTAMVAANGLGDVVQLAGGRILEGVIGVVVAGLLLFYLTRPRVRSAFS